MIPWTVARQTPGSSGYGFLEVRIWSVLPLPSPGDLPNSGIEPQTPTLQVDSSRPEPPGKPFICCCSVMSHSLQPRGLQHARLPVLHHLLEIALTCLHWVSHAIQPCHPLSFPSPPALNLSQLQVFSNESALCIRWPKYWNFSFSISPSSEYSGLISFFWYVYLKCIFSEPWVDSALATPVGNVYLFYLLSLSFLNLEDQEMIYVQQLACCGSLCCMFYVTCEFYNINF